MDVVTTRFVHIARPAAFALLLLGIFSANLQAQQSTAQLPRFSQFRTTGSFFVPDSGATFSAGVSRSGLATRQMGLAPVPGLGQRSSGGSFSRTGASTQVQVYSLREMEAALFESAQPDARKPAPAQSRSAQSRSAQSRSALSQPARIQSATPALPPQALEFNRRLRSSHQPPNTRR